MKAYSGIEELQGAVGTHLGKSPWHKVTQEQIDLFADATGDHQWIHVDVARAKEGPFGTTVAHGYLTSSLIPILVGQVYSVENLRMRVNYGSNSVRFPAPVAVDSELRAAVDLLEVQPSAQGFKVIVRSVIECKGSSKPVCVAETVSLLVP